MTQDQDFDGFVAASTGRLLRLAYLLCGEHARAEDLVQTVLIKLHQALEKGRVVSEPDAYVRRALVNEHISWRRLLATKREVVTAEPDEVLDDRTEQGAQRDLMWRALAQLPRRQRAVLVLRYYEDCSDAAIAASLGCAEATVRSLASRAMAALRRHPGLIAEAGWVDAGGRETL